MKDFICPKEGCESHKFVLVTVKQTLVDFTREGAIEGHPFLESLSTSSGDVVCYVCEEKVSHDMAQEIKQEAI